MHRWRARWIVVRSLLQRDAARRQEVSSPVRSKLPVDVGGVVTRQFERAERLARSLGSIEEELVEHLLPRLGVELRCLRQHAVQVEQTCGDPGRHDPCGPGCGQSRYRRR
jgi:hypothetical protein